MRIGHRKRQVRKMKKDREVQPITQGCSEGVIYEHTSKQFVFMPKAWRKTSNAVFSKQAFGTVFYNNSYIFFSTYLHEI